jgi:hypothetical protein
MSFASTDVNSSLDWLWGSAAFVNRDSPFSSSAKTRTAGSAGCWLEVRIWKIFKSINQHLASGMSRLSISMIS